MNFISVNAFLTAALGKFFLPPVMYVMEIALKAQLLTPFVVHPWQLTFKQIVVSSHMSTNDRYNFCKTLSPFQWKYTIHYPLLRWVHQCHSMKNSAFASTLNPLCLHRYMHLDTILKTMLYLHGSKSMHWLIFCQDCTCQFGNEMNVLTAV